MGHAKHWRGTGVWVGMMLACTCGTSSCTPGELDEKQEKYLRTQLKKYYPPPKPKPDASVADTDDSRDSNDADDSAVNPNDGDDAGFDTNDDESTSGQTGAVETSQTASSAPSTTSESSNVTSVEGDAGGGTVGQIPDCFLQMVSTTCSGVACHYGSAFNSPPDFENESLFELLTTTGSTCSSARSDLYVDLESPEDSYIIQKILGQGCGTPMPPPGFGEVSEAELTCLEDWLESL